MVPLVSLFIYVTWFAVCMTRSSSDKLFELDPEIDRTFHALQRIQKASSSSLSNSSVLTLPMADNNRTLKELAAPDVTYQYSCIRYPEVEGDFELKSGIIHLLPKFNGLSGEDPNRHLHEFHVVCSTMKPHGIAEEDIKLRAFPFSVAGAAKDWLYSLPPGYITCWLDMKRIFLEKFFPASRTASIRKSICGIQQQVGETLYDYWERFKKLCSSCPQHQISDQLLVQYFYEGLLPMDRSMIDAASGGALVNKTPNQARELISNMADNSQQFSSRAIVTRGVSEAHLASTEHQGMKETLQELTSLMRQLTVNQKVPSPTIPPPTMKFCGICSSSDHFTDICPSLHQDEVAAMSNQFPSRSQYQQQNKYDPNSATYNPGWRDHPNLRYGNSFYQQYQPPPAYQKPSTYPNNPVTSSSQPYQPQPQQLPPPNPTGPKLEDLMQQLIQQQQQYQQKTDASIQSMERQISQLASTVNQMQSQGSSQLPSQTIPNPKGNVSAVTLRSGRSTIDPISSVPEADPISVDPLPQRSDSSVPLPFPHRDQ